MQMTNGEIRTAYKQAKNKTEQVKILAELNACDTEKIFEILCETGEYKTEYFNRIRSVFNGTNKRKPKQAVSEPQVLPEPQPPQGTQVTQTPQEISLAQAVNRIKYEINSINSKINALIEKRDKLIREITDAQNS